ncbi:MAG: hypothetical protein ACI406_12115, partial [Victivallis vadensis]
KALLKYLECNSLLSNVGRINFVPFLEKESFELGQRNGPVRLLFRIPIPHNLDEFLQRRQERIVECPFNRIGRLGVSFDILPDPGLVFIHRRRLLGNQNSDIFTKFIHLIDISAHPAVFDCGPNQKRDRRNR